MLGRKLTDNERLVLTCQGIITGLVDDFFDDSEISSESIMQLIMNPEKAEVKKSDQILFKEFYLRSLEKAVNSSENKQQDIKVMNDQFESMDQENKRIEFSRLQEITYQKGGNSVLYYRYGMESLPDIKENDTLYQFYLLPELLY